MRLGGCVGRSHTVRGGEGQPGEERRRWERWSGCNSRVQVSLCGHCGRGGVGGGQLKEGGDCGNRAKIKSREGVLRFVRALRLASFLWSSTRFNLWTCWWLIPSIFYGGSTEEDNRATGSANTIGGFKQYSMRNVIKNSQLIGFLHDKAQSSHTQVKAFMATGLA